MESKTATHDRRQIIIVGIGNSLLGDEGVGNYIVQRLSQEEFGPAIRIADCGTDLLKMMSHLDQPDLIIIVDAVNGSRPPGSIYRFSKDQILKMHGENKAAHNLSAVAVIQLLDKTVAAFQKADVVLFGIQPAQLAKGAGLSPTVSAAADKLIDELKKRCIFGQD